MLDKVAMTDKVAGPATGRSPRKSSRPTATDRSRSTPARKAPPPEGRARSILTEVGDEAKRGAMRARLLEELVQHGWNLTHVAAALRMAGPSAVIRAIYELGLTAAYDAAKDRGDVLKGRPKG